MQPTQLILVRHGETQANLDGRMQGGSGDDPLTERGRRQVQHIAGRLAAEQPRPVAIYSSSLARARLTAEAIGSRLGLDPVVLDELQEMDIGDLEGVSAAELEAVQRTFADLEAAYPGGESIRQFVDRVVGVFGRIVADHAGERVVVVSHGGVISTILAIWSGDGSRWREFVVNNCSYSEVIFAPEPRIVCLGDCAHLEPK